MFPQLRSWGTSTSLTSILYLVLQLDRPYADWTQPETASPP